jgi:hypothetical protein
MYLGISLPVIGEGIAATHLGLRTAGIAFSLGVAAIAAVAFTTLIPARTRTTHPVPPAVAAGSAGSGGAQPSAAPVGS